MDSGSAMYLLMAGGILMAVIGMTIIRMGDDPLKSAAYVCFFIGAMDVLIAVLVATVGMAFAVEHGVAAVVVMIIALVVGAEGVIFLGLGVGIARESKLCAFIAAALYTVLSIVSVGGGGGGALCVTMLRMTFSIILWRAYFNAVQLAQLDSIADARRAQFEAEKRMRGGSATSAALPPARALPGTGLYAAPADEAPPAGRLVLKKTAPAGARPTLSVCPNCKRTYTTARPRCVLCNVHLYEEA
jgi:hypothetical protein